MNGELIILLSETCADSANFGEREEYAATTTSSMSPASKLVG